jgi:hypothetical protein
MMIIRNPARSPVAALVVITGAALLTLSAGPAFAQADTAAPAEPAAQAATAAADGKPDGLAVAKLADQARRADTERQVMTMTLENSRGQQRVRTIAGWSKEMGDDTEYRFSRFLEPSDVKDTTLLSYDYTYEDDDTWLYLPALKKVKRILSSNKTDYFMGSDFTYEDMENLDLINWDYSVIGEEKIDGTDCWIVQAVPNNDKKRDETGYSKTVTWYAKDDHIARKAEFYDKKDRLAKRLTLEDVRVTSPDDPRKRAHKMTMENFLTKHKTVLDITELKLDVAVDDEVFSQRNLRQ